MATTETPEETGAPADLASQVRGADLVRVVSRADGDGLAAAAILGRACADQDLPRHVSVSPSREAATARLEESGAGIALGFDGPDGFCSEDSAALCAYETAVALGANPDPGLALAGAVAAGVPPKGPALEAAEEQGIERRAGLSVPTTDVTTGLAYTGLLHADFSGDEEATSAFLEDLDLADPRDTQSHKTLASAVAMEVTDGPTGKQAIESLQRALGPLESPGPFETVGGYADVLGAAASLDPGKGLVALLGSIDEDRLLDLWQTYGATLHEAVADLSESDGEPLTTTVEDVSPLDVAGLGYTYAVDADRLYVSGSDSIALAAGEDNARSVLASKFEEESVTGTDTLATVATDADLEAIVEDIEAAS